MLGSLGNTIRNAGGNGIAISPGDDDGLEVNVRRNVTASAIAEVGGHAISDEYVAEPAVSSEGRGVLRGGNRPASLG